jgi:diguanylate cyclase (GGDEF)-like protein
MAGAVWNEPEGEEESAPQRIHIVARRTALWSLLLMAVLLCTAIGVPRRHGGDRLLGMGMWALFGTSLVVVVHALVAYWRARDQARRQALKSGLSDPLTGLPNRRGLMTELEKYDQSPQQLGKRVRLVDVDLVNLDRVNYEFGQPVGDAVLQDIANLLRSIVPSGNLVGRLGGDEFLAIMPQASQSEAEALCQTVKEAIAGYRLNLGERGEIHSLKANVSMAAYVPEQASLHETVISAKEATSYAKLPGMGEDEEARGYYHVPRVTLGAFAVHRWQDLGKAEQDEFKQWQRELPEGITDRMASDIMRLLDEKADSNWVDFVTAIPAAGGAGGGRTYPARHLAERVAKLIGTPYRDVMRADTSGPESRTVEPTVDAVIDKGDGALVISDVISSGIVERRSVKKLSASGAHVQIIAWVAY